MVRNVRNIIRFKIIKELELIESSVWCYKQKKMIQRFYYSYGGRSFSFMGKEGPSVVNMGVDCRKVKLEEFSIVT